jgi:hypothetical protein
VFRKPARTDIDAAASVGILLVALLTAVALACASGGGEETPAPTITPQSGTPEPTPEPQTLVQPGYVVDQVLNVSLDGSPTGQIVIISHTAAPGEEGEPTPTAPLEVCPDHEALQGAPSPCAFRIDIFALRPEGWTSAYVLQQTETAGVGVAQSVEAQKFAVGSGFEALWLHLVLCSEDVCPLDHNIIFTMREGQVVSVFNTRNSTVRIEGMTAIVDEPVYEQGEPICCPSSRQIVTIGLNHESGAVEVLESEEFDVTPPGG